MSKKVVQVSYDPKTGEVSLERYRLISGDEEEHYYFIEQLLEAILGNEGLVSARSNCGLQHDKQFLAALLMFATLAADIEDD